jgi:PilZ domain
MQDRRRVQRTSVLKNAKIILRSGASVFDCTLLDLTNLGSCLALTSPGAGVPDAFELSFDHAVSSRKCHVIWRSEDKLGVSFGDPVNSPVEIPYLTRG